MGRRQLTSNNGELRRLTEMDDSWMDDAACKGKDTNSFYDFPSHNPTVLQDIKTFCHLSCPVRQRCLAWALYVPEPEGVWGGLSPDERRALRRRPDVRKALQERPLLDTAV